MVTDTGTRGTITEIGAERTTTTTRMAEAVGTGSRDGIAEGTATITTEEEEGGRITGIDIISNIIINNTTTWSRGHIRARGKATTGEKEGTIIEAKRLYCELNLT